MTGLRRTARRWFYATMVVGLVGLVVEIVSVRLHWLDLSEPLLTATFVVFGRYQYWVGRVDGAKSKKEGRG